MARQVHSCPDLKGCMMYVYSRHDYVFLNSPLLHFRSTTPLCPSSSSWPVWYLPPLLDFTCSLTIAVGLCDWCSTQHASYAPSGVWKNDDHGCNFAGYRVRSPIRCTSFPRLRYCLHYQRSWPRLPGQFHFDAPENVTHGAHRMPKPTDTLHASRKPRRQRWDCCTPSTVIPPIGCASHSAEPCLRTRRALRPFGRHPVRLPTALVFPLPCIARFGAGQSHPCRYYFPVQNPRWCHCRYPWGHICADKAL